MSLSKWDYVRLISEASDRYGNKLLQMMEQYNKGSLIEMTLEEVKEFYEQLNKK